MSTTELLDAYVRGEIGRRTFIRGLVARGVSLEAAASHAVALRSHPGFGEDDLDADDDEGGGNRDGEPAQAQP